MSRIITVSTPTRPGQLARAAFLGASLVAALGMACSSPPSALVDPPDEFLWSTAFADLDDAVLSVCGQGETVLAVGGDNRAAILEWTGVAWYVAPTPSAADVLWWCWIDPDGAAWAVGESGTLLRRDATGWRSPEVQGAISSDVTLYGIWGSAADHVFAVGGSLTNGALNPTIAHYDGSTWTPVVTDGLPEQPLFKVWGSAADDVWAVGADGLALHYDGTGWTTTDTGSSARLTAVWGTASDDVYAVGGQGTGVVLHWNGTGWSTFASVSEELAGVWTAPGQPLYVGGNRGLLARYRLASDGRASAELGTLVTPVTDLDVHAVYGDPQTEVVAVAASDLLGGSVTGWRGSLLTHGNRSLAGPLDSLDLPDAGVADAGVTDAGVIDARPGGPGPGELCGQLPTVCAAGLECWLVLSTNEYLCTQPCTDARECDAYGPDACCARPGFQTLETVCLAAGYPECTKANP